MDLSFETRKLRKICQDPDYSHRVYGVELASELILRLAELRAAETLDSIADLLPGLRVETDVSFSITLYGPFRLHFDANHAYSRRNHRAPLVMADVTRVKITRIG